jgi:hypothetical protein
MIALTQEVATLTQEVATGIAGALIVSFLRFLPPSSTAFIAMRAPFHVVVGKVGANVFAI